MKKVFFLFLSFLFSFMMLFKCCAKEKQTVVVGLDVNVMPFGFIDETGKIAGFDIDLAEAVFEKLDRKVVFQPINWDSKELELNSGKIDVIWNGMSYTKERAKNMELSKAYIKNSQILVFRKGEKLDSLKEIKEKKIAVQKGSTGFEAIVNSKILDEGEIGKNVIQLENMVDCLNEVLIGHSFGAVLDESVFKYYLKEKKLYESFEIFKEPLSKENYVIGFKKGNVGLKNEVESVLFELVKSKKAREISQKWFGEDLVILEDVEEKRDGFKKLEKLSLLVELLKGFLVSLKLFFFCILFSVPLGLFICFLRVKEIKILNIIIDLYIILMRGTPLLLQILFMFYGMPIIFPNFAIKDRFLIGIIAFILNYAAYFAEIFRGGFKSVEKGQFDAINVLKIPKIRAMFMIILPQMFNVCLPSLCNETITLVKDTALIFSIGVIELLTTAKNMVNRTVSITPYIVAALIYLLMGFLINMLFKLFEKKLKF